nr:stage V sporulation protein AA [Acetatifactor sp.]
RNVEVTQRDVYLNQIGNIQCSDSQTTAKLEEVRIHRFDENEPQRTVVSAIKLIRLIEEVNPAAVVEMVGETDVLIEYVKNGEKSQKLQVWKITLVCLISFFGTAFTIMAYHNDIGINEIFAEIYRIVMGREAEGINVLEISYSIGLALGIVLFFNHVGGRRITKDPTPIEVAMRNYEEDVNKSLIANAEREKIEEN